MGARAVLCHAYVLMANHVRKALIALAIKRETTVPPDWLGSRLHMGTRSTVSRVTAAMALKIAKDKKLARQHHLIVKGAS